MKTLRGFGSALIAAAAAAVLVLGFPAAASAATWTQYFNGYTFQNQTEFSGYHTMSGGRAQSIVLLSYARITQRGIGSQNGGNLVTMTHDPVYTESYCQWKAVDNQGTNKFLLTCWYLK
ncbi:MULTISPECIES: hypothetical protein [unclassified Microbacterium]|uniref:hypothetical protein n=1 Tax=unclassified Microbacterium TaxID=2609290 RepID=UPI0012F97D65|nr:hypothetical protein [Microbacterium sp. MAH-37]MVQ41414.1 hypothetical protein [Microbacterium sp. MAH-37]